MTFSDAYRINTRCTGVMQLAGVRFDEIGRRHVVISAALL